MTFAAPHPGECRNGHLGMQTNCPACWDRYTEGITMIIPLGSHVVLRRNPTPQQSAGGLALPTGARPKPLEGTVIAVGPGAVLKRGRRQAMQLAVGDRVLFASHAGTDIRVAGDEQVVIEECDVIARLETAAG
jgi:chaperonin GroES